MALGQVEGQVNFGITGTGITGVHSGQSCMNLMNLNKWKKNWKFLLTWIFIYFPSKVVFFFAFLGVFLKITKLFEFLSIFILLFCWGILIFLFCFVELMFLTPFC
jgi:hypothetical protein